MTQSSSTTPASPECPVFFLKLFGVVGDAVVIGSFIFSPTPRIASCSPRPPCKLASQTWSHRTWLGMEAPLNSFIEVCAVFSLFNSEVVGAQRLQCRGTGRQVASLPRRSERSRQSWQPPQLRRRQSLVSFITSVWVLRHSQGPEYGNVG